MKSSTQSITTSKRGGDPFDQIPRHPRYLSDWSSNVVTINTAHELDQDIKPYHIKLSEITLSGQGGEGLVTEIEPLTEFPHFLNSLKVVINAMIPAYHSSFMRPRLANAVSDAHKIFAWMLRNNRPTFDTLRPDDLKKLSESVGLDGWWKVLNYEAALRIALSQCEQSPAYVAQLSICKISAINHHFLSNLIGLPVAPQHIPRWFRERVAKLDGKILQDYIYRHKHLTGQSSEHKDTLQTLQRFCLLPYPFDSIAFLAYPRIAPEARRVSRLRDRRTSNRKASETANDHEAGGDDSTEDLDASTPNIPLAIATKLFSTAITWLYDYRHAILQVLDQARNDLELSLSQGNIKQSLDYEKFNKILENHGIPITLTNSHKRKKEGIEVSLTVLVATMFFSCAILILINHGRRPQEAIGRGLPYGLYFGSVESVTPELAEKRIEFYIEKSPREYATFWCTQMVVDAVNTLEEIAQRFRPLFTEHKQIQTDLHDRRADKLFEQRIFSYCGFSAPAMLFSWRQQSRFFFDQAGVDRKIFSGKQLSFRRLFMSLYVHRYDCPELYALKEHLCDLRIESLIAYFRDPLKRSTSEKVELEIRRYEEQDNIDIDALLREASSTYLNEKIAELLRGEPFSGAFPRLVRKLIKAMIRSTEYQSASLLDKADIVTNEIERRGYSPDPKETGVCMLGSNKTTRKHSKCFRNGAAHPEDASPTVCSGCLHAFNSQSYVRIFEEDRDESKSRSEDKHLPSSVRSAHAAHANVMTQIIELERNMASENREALAEFISAWNHGER